MPALADLGWKPAEIPVDHDRLFGEAAERLSRVLGDLCVPVNYLKIDGECVRRLGSGRIDQEVVRAIVRLAGSVGTRTIAEFVGDQPTLDLLSDYGVDYAQGYHLGAPRPVAAL